VHKSSVVGERGIKLYVTEYVTVPPATSVGTFIERRSVEFCPFTGGSGKKEREVREKTAVALEQSVTEPDALVDRNRARMAVSNMRIHTVNEFMPLLPCFFTIQMQP
jgi:hypothetical protein